jgi:hypothetical protein
MVESRVRLTGSHSISDEGRFSLSLQYTIQKPSFMLDAFPTAFIRYCKKVTAQVNIRKAPNLRFALVLRTSANLKFGYFSKMAN